jgi:hypothetical protein
LHTACAILKARILHQGGKSSGHMSVQQRLRRGTRHS